MEMIQDERPILAISFRKPFGGVNALVVLLRASMRQAIAGSTAENSPSRRKIELSDALRAGDATLDCRTNKPKPSPAVSARRLRRSDGILHRELGSIEPDRVADDVAPSLALIATLYPISGTGSLIKGHR